MKTLMFICLRLTTCLCSGVVSSESYEQVFPLIPHGKFQRCLPSQYALLQKKSRVEQHRGVSLPPLWEPSWSLQLALTRWWRGVRTKHAHHSKGYSCKLPLLRKGT